MKTRIGSKSKRVSCAKRYNVQKKIKNAKANAKRQEKRQGRKNPDSRKKLRKDPGIPNLWPFKEELLQHMEITRLKAEEDRKRRHAEAASLKRKAPGPSPAQLAAAGERGDEYDKREERAIADAARDGQIAAIAQDHSRRQFYKKFRQVVEAADVILEVLDSRDPMASRCKEAEQLAREGGKKVVLVLNKIDLVPRDIASRWVARLRDELPTIAFKASTQRGGSISQKGVGSAQKAPEDLIQSTSECLGGEQLMQLLKNYCRSGAAAARSITVGVIGYPNVGKSSLINSLKRTRAVGVSSTPGSTRDISEVKIDKNIRLLDSPGIVFVDADAAKSPLLSAGSVRFTDTSIEASSRAEPLVASAPRQHLLSTYGVASFDSPAEFLSSLAKRRGKVLKGGLPDVEAAARIVLSDVAAGRLPYWVEPPAREAGVMLESEIVSGGDDVLSALPEQPALEKVSEEDDKDSAMQADEKASDDGEPEPEPDKKKRRKDDGLDASKRLMRDDVPDVLGNPAQNPLKELKKKVKADKKKLRKGKAIAEVAGEDAKDADMAEEPAEEAEAEAAVAVSEKPKKGKKGKGKGESYDFMKDFYSGENAF